MELEEPRMTSPTEEGSDAVDEALKSSEEALNSCSKDGVPSFADSNMTSQVESTLINRELDMPNSEEQAAPQQADNNELEGEKNKRDPQEDLKVESLIIQIPIPRKWTFLNAGLGRISHLNTPLVSTDGMKLLGNRAGFCSGNMTQTNKLCYTTISYKIPFQFSISWRRPFIGRHVIRSMTFRLLCRRYFSQAARHQNITWVNQRSAAFLTNPNFHPREERVIFQRSSRVYYDRPLLERLTLKRKYQSTDSKGRKNFRIFVRSVYHIPPAHFENASNTRDFVAHLRSHRNLRMVIANTGDGLKYICPICGGSFNNLVEFRQHSCNSPGN